MIEHAKCKGLDVGQNLKRGGPEISTDFIAWRTGGHLEGVDIASGYDDTSSSLRLIGTPTASRLWIPYYKAFGSASCS